MADAAEQQGMEVVRIFHPNATKERVKRHANGAHLFIYAGHGNGWPSAFGPFQERTKNGIGINPTKGDRTTSNVKYYGADWLRANIELAPDAVVILVAPLLRVRQRVVGHAHPDPVGRGPARRQLRERLPRHRRPRRVGARLAAGSRRHPGPPTTTRRWTRSS